MQTTFPFTTFAGTAISPIQLSIFHCQFSIVDPVDVADTIVVEPYRLAARSKEHRYTVPYDQGTSMIDLKASAAGQFDRENTEWTKISKCLKYSVEVFGCHGSSPRILSIESRIFPLQSMILEQNQPSNEFEHLPALIFQASLAQRRMPARIDPKAAGHDSNPKIEVQCFDRCTANRCLALDSLSPVGPAEMRIPLVFPWIEKPDSLLRDRVDRVGPIGF